MKCVGFERLNLCTEIMSDRSEMFSQKFDSINRNLLKPTHFLIPHVPDYTGSTVPLKVRIQSSP